MAEFSTLQKQIESIPSSGPRYSSDLAKYVPENSVIYAAIPNVGGTIEEAKRLFDDRLDVSPDGRWLAVTGSRQISLIDLDPAGP